jgi:outer membrane receptor protein involved in Fe transport
MYAARVRPFLSEGVTMTKSFLRHKLLATTIFASAAFTPAYAQDPQNPAQEAAEEGTLEEQVADEPAHGEEGDGEIVITGSRIPRPDLSSSGPLAVATAAEIGVSGESANVENFLNQLPQFIPSTTGTSNNPGNGLATIDLRGAGAARTLVLVDGKRYVPSTLGGLVDLNNIPTPLVERVEVVTGGASAVYGSDAMAGVVNFVLKQDFTGAQLDSSYRVTEQGDSSIFTTALTLGSNFADNRGNAAVLVSYTDRAAAFASARDYSRVVLLDSVPALNSAGTIASGGCVPGSLNSFNLGTRAPPAPWPIACPASFRAARPVFRRAFSRASDRPERPSTRTASRARSSIPTISTTSLRSTICSFPRSAGSGRRSPITRSATRSCPSCAR